MMMNIAVFTYTLVNASVCVLAAADARILADCVLHRSRNLRGRRHHILRPGVRRYPAVGRRQDRKHEHIGNIGWEENDRARYTGWEERVAVLTLSASIPLTLYTLPCWSNPPFLIVDIRALWRSGLSARAPECQKLKMMGLTSMVLNTLNSSNLEQLALKGLNEKTC